MTVPVSPEAHARKLLTSTEAAHRLGLQTISQLDMRMAEAGIRAVEGPTGTLRWRQGDIDRYMLKGLSPNVVTSAENGDAVVLILLGSIAIIVCVSAWVVYKAVHG